MRPPQKSCRCRKGQQPVLASAGPAGVAPKRWAGLPFLASPPLVDTSTQEAGWGPRKRVSLGLQTRLELAKGRTGPGPRAAGWIVRHLPTLRWESAVSARRGPTGEIQTDLQAAEMGERLYRGRPGLGLELLHIRRPQTPGSFQGCLVGQAVERAPTGSVAVEAVVQKEWVQAPVLPWVRPRTGSEVRSAWEAPTGCDATAGPCACAAVDCLGQAGKAGGERKPRNEDRFPWDRCSAAR